MCNWVIAQIQMFAQLLNDDMFNSYNIYYQHILSNPVAFYLASNLLETLCIQVEQGKGLPLQR